MADIKIRNIDPVVVKKIDEQAKAKGLSRSEYLRKYLMKLSELEDVRSLDEKYAQLVSAVAERIERMGEVIEINNMLLERVEDRLR